MISQSEAVSLLTTIFQADRSDVDVGAGVDDVGIVKVHSGRLAVTVDFINSRLLGADLGVSSLADKGYLLVFHNVSDLIASGATPLFAVIALGLPSTFSRQDVEEIGRGIRLAADECGVIVVGGDTKESPHLSLGATLIGKLERSGHWSRTGAKPGDSVFISGNIGGTTSSVLALHRLVADSAIFEFSKNTLNSPRLPLELAKKLRESDIPIGGIDLSDGLGLDTYRLADASNVGVELYAANIPLHPLVYAVAAALKLDPIKLAFGCGGDGQFVFTVNPRDEPFVRSIGAIKIGTVLNSLEKRLVTANGVTALPKFGHEDFTGQSLSERLLSTFLEPLS